MISVSDKIESAALRDLHEAGQDLAGPIGLQIFRDGDATISVAGHAPSSAIVLNRAILPADWLADAGKIAGVTDIYAKAKVGRYFVQGSPIDETALAENNLGKARGWQKFRRGRQSVAGRSTDLSIRQIGPDHGADFGRIVSAAFDVGDISAPLLARLPGRANWHIFMSFDGDTPAGAGALFVKDGIAWTDWGATDPTFRQRGSQSALLAARVQHAINLGCSQIFTCTGEAVAGDPQHSYGNIERMGFEPVELRRNFQPV